MHLSACMQHLVLFWVLSADSGSSPAAYASTIIHGIAAILCRCLPPGLTLSRADLCLAQVVAAGNSLLLLWIAEC